MPATNPLAVQLYSVREQLPGATRKGVLERITQRPVTAPVEAFDVLSDTEGLRADLDAAGLTVCSVHAIPSGEQAADVLAATRTLGAGTVIVPAGRVRYGRFRRKRGQRAESDGGPSRGQPACASAIATTTSSCRPSWTGSRPLEVLSKLH